VTKRRSDRHPAPLLSALSFLVLMPLAEAAVSEPEWVSPLADDGCEEFWNERFLQRLDLLDNADKSCTPLRMKSR
jgi:hypothetical protein